MMLPNQPDAADPARSHWLASHDQWRRVADPERVTPMAINTASPVTKIKPDESRVRVYLRAGRLSMHGYCLTNIAGFVCEPHVTLNAEVPDSELGTVLLRALTEARLAPIPNAPKVQLKKALSNVGVTSWAKLGEAARCSVSMTPEEISISPTCSAGRGLAHKKELTIRISSSSTPAQIGQALREGFKRCT
jgi:hypothetical protein